jgi:hypothetical protein
VKERLLIGIAAVIVLGGILIPMVSAVADTLYFVEEPAQLGGRQACGEATPANAGACRQIEELILNATVRFQITTWVVLPDESGYDVDHSTGHATLKDGRYLVTHNHFSVPLSIRPRAGEPEAYATVTLYDKDGEPLFKAPLSDFRLIQEEPGTLVIGYKDDDLFERLGFVSATFEDWGSAALEAGMEVAQVDWDGTTTRVDWVTVDEVDVEEGVPRLILDDDVLIGASGGGIFWRGAHVANNWAEVMQFEPSGAFIGTKTMVALNSAEVAGAPDQVVPSG